MELQTAVRALLRCTRCAAELVRPVTLACGHSVCAAHPTCDECDSTLNHRMLPSGVAFYSSDLTHGQTCPVGTDVTLSNILALCSQRQWWSDFQRRLLSELSCHVCLHLVVDAVTTPCQHTFCADCLERSSDHHLGCPLCRKPLPVSSYLLGSWNHRLINAIVALAFSETYVQRKRAIEVSQHHYYYNTPIFRCSLSFPGLPTYLHIFEPKYRLMIRRCICSMEPRFGMMMPSVAPAPSPGEPEHSAADYGTMLLVKSVQMFPDGRSMVETVGVSRFRLLEAGLHDGYHVGRVERIDDVEDSAMDTDCLPVGDTDLQLLKVAPEIATQSAEELMAQCQAFLRQLRHATAPWVGQKLDSAHGPPPDDPVSFSFWMAQVLPIHEREKARLLPLRSARARLALIATWIEQLSCNSEMATGCVIA